jgi:glycosyltransferase involved in cell wall biosynthesis
MRIAVVNHSRRKVGGAEVYLDSVLPALSRSGHELAWIYEDDPPSTRQPIASEVQTSTFPVGELGVEKTLETLRTWRPDVIYTHGLTDPNLEASIIAVAPSVLYVHNYYGTCISGDKFHRSSRPHTCERRFGAACLLHYFPDRCGGRNPLTMISSYRRQSRRLELMRRYSGLVTNSEHMVRELARHQLAAECVYPFLSPDATPTSIGVAYTEDPLRLLFAGRMSHLKGGQYLIAAMPEVQRKLNRPVRLTLAGDGPDRHLWEREAKKMTTDSLAFDFPGWLTASDLNEVMCRTHLLVFPSVWPEPFGLSGLEAGVHGVPSVAFASGGIPEWLHAGVNGHLASVPPSAAGLADAITAALVCGSHYEKLRAGAFLQARRFTLDGHIASLMQVFEKCLA